MTHNQLTLMSNRETERHNRAIEDYNQDTLWETKRHSVTLEGLQSEAQAEVARHNRVTELEQQRYHILYARELEYNKQVQDEKNRIAARANEIQELITQEQARHNLFQEATDRMRAEADKQYKEWSETFQEKELRYNTILRSVDLGLTGIHNANQDMHNFWQDVFKGVETGTDVVDTLVGVADEVRKWVPILGAQ